MAGERLWPVADRATRVFWRVVGRKIDLSEDTWLQAPTAVRGPVEDSWIHTEALRIGGTVGVGAAVEGLLPRMDALAGPDFDPSRLTPSIRDFYERTSTWRMQAWTQWAPGFAPWGSLVERFYGRRVQQLALPVNLMSVACGVDSSITRVADADGRHAGSAWLRTLRKSGDYLFSGYYRITLLPSSSQPCIHVSFPLESGNVQVFLHPEVCDDGSLLLTSGQGEFGDIGAYVTVVENGKVYAARIPIHERFHVFEDSEGVLRTDHELRLWRARAMALHYRMDPR